MKRESEKGVALITVLLLVAVMSALAVGVLEDIRFGLRRAANAETVGQAQWYALGAESLAEIRIKNLDQDRFDGGAWNGRWLTFPIDNGVIRARLSDATNCFNLNSVVEGVSDQWTRRALGIAQFVTLLQEIGINEGEAHALGETLADWIDSDGARNTQGGEDDVYADLLHPYRTSGALLSETSELRAVRGFTPEIYARIRPFVCALPTADLSPININTLGVEDAVLLTALTGGGLNVANAERLIESRPETGWTDSVTFWNEPLLQDHIPEAAALEQVSTRTNYFALETEIDYAGNTTLSTALLEKLPDGDVTRRARRWTRDE
ncbi:MAG: hypothetical protein RJB62_684 [Pseudomonadota bacterium]|jgi:general secretion pathway protein K